MITDEYKGYNRVSETMLHAIITHAESYADGHVHTNTIEGFWALIKRAWYGSHHHYSRKYMPLYIAETCYNNRRSSATASHGVGARPGSTPDPRSELQPSVQDNDLPEQVEAFCDTWEMDAQKEAIARSMPVLMREHVDDYYVDFWRLWMQALRTQPHLLAYLIFMSVSM